MYESLWSCTQCTALIVSRRHIRDCKGERWHAVAIDSYGYSYTFKPGRILSGHKGPSDVDQENKYRKTHIEVSGEQHTQPGPIYALFYSYTYHYPLKNPFLYFIFTFTTARARPPSPTSAGYIM